MRSGIVAWILLLSGCGDDDCCTIDAAADAWIQDANASLVEVALIPATVNRDVDLLFVIDDSPSMLDKQTNLKASFPLFTNVLNTVQGGLPNLQIGVITTDMGTKAADDPTAGTPIGSGPGSCAGSGKDGVLQVFSATVNGNYLVDIANTDGTRATNYSDSLDNAFAAAASAGTNGCGFEQPLEAIRRALSDQALNAGFVRSAARLGIIVLSDEDDCSPSTTSIFGPDTATFGPLQSFRCTRFGVTCDVAGTTSEEMNQPSDKGSCHSNESSPYMTDVGRYATFINSLKIDPRDVMFGAIVGATTPFTVELRTPPGGGTAIPALAHSCKYAGANGDEVADPAVRLAQVASAVRRGSVSSVCNGDLSAVMTEMGQRIKTLVGDPCVERAIAMPAQCEVFDVTASGTFFVPPCGGATTTNCFTLVTDPTGCPAGQQQRLEVTRSVAPSPETWTSLRCAI